MSTLNQTLLLGTERTGPPAAPPHPALAAAWQQLDWGGARETALLEAAALAGTARCAAAVPNRIAQSFDPAPAETRPYASLPAVAVLRRLFSEEWRALLPEWMELCARHGALIPPFFLRTLYQLATGPADREFVRRIAGERGRWLARMNPEWSWLHTGSDPAAAPHPAQWETGTPDERLAVFLHRRRSDPAAARDLLEQTWGEEAPDFREQLIEAMRSGLGPADEPFLTRTLKDKRKGVRAGAQALLASLPQSQLSTRMRAHAEALLVCARSFLSRKLEVNLPAAFEPDWTADAIEQKPPTGVGEKAFWAHQILSLVPLRHWADKFALEPAKLVELAAKSPDWADLLLGAWYRSACLHRDAETSAVLIPVILNRQKPPVPGLPAPTAAANLLAQCHPAQRWQVVAETAELAWAALPLLEGQPEPSAGRALFSHLARALRDGFNPGGSPAAVLAARCIPPSLHAEAARQLTRENGLSKPAETFLQALELRAAMHEAFHPTHRSP
jgi:hypothetical protein